MSDTCKRCVAESEEAGEAVLCLSCHEKADALPAAAWFAEHGMGWHQHAPAPTWALGWSWHSADGHFIAPPSWDPRTNDADALQLLDAIAQQQQSEQGAYPMWRLSLHQAEYVCLIMLAGGHVQTRAPTRTTAICRAVHAYVLAQQEART